MPTRVLIIAPSSEFRKLTETALKQANYRVCFAQQREEILEKLEEGKPDMILLDLDHEGIEVCSHLKQTDVGSHIPVVLLSSRSDAALISEGSKARADDYLKKPIDPEELVARIEMNVARSRRSLDANPTTKLPGNASINMEIRRRINNGGIFAVCYADLDNFKAFNDKYGYFHGDRIILLTSHIIRDIVKDLSAEDNFIGHIGGDDFIFIVPVDKVEPNCEQIIKTFDAIIIYRYTEADRRRGYIISTDRKNKKGIFPLMTISIGVVTNRHRTFFHPAHVSALATEMKNFVKTMEGSNYAVDRRGDDEEFIGRQRKSQRHLWDKRRSEWLGRSPLEG